MSKFYIKDSQPFSVRLSNFVQSLFFWKGRKKGMVHTRDIAWDDIRAIFFPKSFEEKYSYLGSVPYETGKLFNALEPLVIFMDYKARPKFCPRWFLRFLYVFGSDSSIVRVRNWTLHNLLCNLTNGIMIVDYKTKWDWYDLRISIRGNDQMYDLADAIETEYYETGRRIGLADKIKELDPNTAFDSGYPTSMLKDELNRLQAEINQTS